MIRVFSLPLFLAVAGCSGYQAVEVVGDPPLLAVSAVSTAVLVATDKTVADHIASTVMGEDCSTVAYMADGHYCRPYPETVMVVREPLYCYRTLADVECHAVPNPFGGNPAPVSPHFTREVAYPASASPEEVAKRASFR